MKSSKDVAAQSVDVTKAESCATSFACGPDVETGANGRLCRSGTREQLGPVHGALGKAGRSVFSAAGGDDALSGCEVALAFRMTT